MTAAATPVPVPLAAIPAPPERPNWPRRPLTPHQERIARLVAAGMSNKGIACELGCTEQAVKTQVSAALDRTGLVDRVGLTLWVIRERLIVPLD